MKSKIFLILIVLQSSLLSQKMLTVEDIFGTSKFRVQSWTAESWRPENPRYTYYEKCNGDHCIFQINTETGEKYLLINSQNLPILNAPTAENRFTIPNYLWMPDGRSLLIPSSGNLYLYSLDSREVTQLTRNQEPERDPSISPNGKWIAYTRENTLYALHIDTQKEIMLVHHKDPDRLIGRFDWVYEEEFNIRRGFWWSPDSRFIAFYELDVSEEPVYQMVNELPGQQTIDRLRYPKAGDPNAKIRIGIVTMANQNITWMDIGKNPDIYIPRIHWLPDSKTLAIQRLNRPQNRLDLIFSNIRSGRSRVVLTEQDPNGWVDIPENPVFLRQEDAFIWHSERDNRAHLYKIHDGSVFQITRGNWDVTKLVHVDENHRWIYFMATEVSPLERHLYRIGTDGTGLTQITRRNGEHLIDMSPDGSRYIDTFSSLTTPPQVTLHHSSGELIAVLASGEISELADYELAVPEFIAFTTADRLNLNAMLLKPVNFNPDNQYPVLIYTYSGPGSQIVMNNWRSGQGKLWHQLLAQQGYCIFALDNRGTGFMGDDFKNLLYRDISRGLQDIIEASDRIKKLDYIDPDRIGIWGWSGGAWMTCLAMTKGAGHFKCGIAVAPVSDLRNYDSIWTERYMGLPADNPAGYDACSPMTYVSRLEGRLLLVHGTADDNVHPSNTLQLANALQNENKPFDMMLYPGKNHNISGSVTRVHLYRMMTDFIMDNL